MPNDRHAADEGPLQGEFPVDHDDAVFAPDLAKLKLGQTARLLAGPPRPSTACLRVLVTDRAMTNMLASLGGLPRCHG